MNVETTVEQDAGVCVMTEPPVTEAIACPECAGAGTVQVSKVRSMRITLGLTTHALATALGVSLRTLQRWEAGQEPRVLYMEKLEAMVKEREAK